jgi:urease accessory protein
MTALMTDSATPTGPLPSSRGTGHIVLERQGTRTIATRASASSPLRLLTPRNAGGGAWIFASNFGGGLLAGDELTLHVHAGAKTLGYLGTQSSTKVYRSDNGLISSQSLTATIEPDAFLTVMPDPLVCFAGARYRQTQRFDLAPTSSLVLLDWFTSGRHASGERWAATSFGTSNEIWIDGKCVLRDRLRLDDGPTGAVGEGLGMRVFNCLASAILIAGTPDMATHVTENLRWFAQQPVQHGSHLPLGASPILGGRGIIMRVAGVSVEAVAQVMYERLAFLGQFLGECPWKRRP